VSHRLTAGIARYSRSTQFRRCCYHLVTGVLMCVVNSQHTSNH